MGGAKSKPAKSKPATSKPATSKPATEITITEESYLGWWDDFIRIYTEEDMDNYGYKSGINLYIDSAFEKDPKLNDHKSENVYLTQMPGKMPRGFSDYIRFEYITHINGYVFKNRTWLKSIKLPSVKYIGIEAFYGCTNLTYVFMPSVTYIGKDAFNGCTNLTFVDMGNVKKICARAFYNCENLKNVITSENPEEGFQVFGINPELGFADTKGWYANQLKLRL